MTFSAEEYRAAAGDRLREAQLLSRAGESAAAHYVSGIAIECILRAYRRRISGQFVNTHDLVQLAGPYYDAVLPRRRGQVAQAINEAARIWRNNHRYCSPRKLKAYLLSTDTLDRSHDILKENALRMVARAQLIVAAGESRWYARDDDARGSRERPAPG